MITADELKAKLDSLSASLEEQRAIKKERGWRNKANPLMLDYVDYLKTKLWEEIKQRILLRDGHTCRRCSGKADVVHHISYDDDVKLGLDDTKLASLCSGCHEIVHFTTGGVPRPPEEQLAALTDLSFNEPLPKLDMRAPPWNRPNWQRLTAVQKQTYCHEYNQKMASKLAGAPSNNSFKPKPLRGSA